MHTSFLTAIAALATSTVAAPLEAREGYATWSATDVTTHVAHIQIGSKFHLTAPAGYVSDAPAFDVICDVSILDDPEIQPCVFNSEQATGSKVEAAWSTTDAPVTVYHTFGSTKVWGSSGALAFNADFMIDVMNVGSA
ncbi:hypothetical protein FHL15_006769 [Xylaria flabelliformis]|uniref:AA1-like domain-containing protein n=1 Tax=Xylaria flabelliformis TaxID=2512241 RepID=A0A553HWR1_9PEZI|nr:hypothetical protein FHL15_006769 [Xylaria flabelliformis]